MVLSYSGITVLSFANKVVKVQPQKFVRSLYGVSRTLHYIDSAFTVTRPVFSVSCILIFSTAIVIGSTSAASVPSTTK